MAQNEYFTKTAPKKLMILGASILQLPAITKAKEMGHIVIAVDQDKHAIGNLEADICLDISTTDISNVIKAAKEYQIDGIMTLASDLPVPTIAAVAEELNIVGISKETALKATNKGLMRACLNEHNVPIPAFATVNNLREFEETVQRFEGKIIVKPADNSGSRGVYLITDPRDKNAIEYAYNYSKHFSRSGEVLVEEYMEGIEVSIEALSINDEIHIISITDKFTTGAPEFTEMGHSQPSNLPETLKNEIIATTKAAIRAIGINNGPSHTEIIVTKEGPKIVELGARLGGDNITTHLVPLSTGIDLVKCCIDIAFGDTPKIDRKFTKGSAIRYFETRPGKIISYHAIDKAMEIEGVRQISFLKKIGEFVGDLKDSSDRVGFVITQADNAVAAIRACDTVKKTIEIVINDSID